MRSKSRAGESITKVATDDPIMASVAGRYASALLELAKQDNKLSDVETQLNSFENLLTTSPDLKRMVLSPVFSAAEQGNALGAVLDKAGIGGLTANFLKLLAKNRRLFVAADIIGAFKALVARERGEVVAEVTSAHPLSDAQKAQLVDTLKDGVTKTIKLDAKVDPSLLGGLVVKIGSRMIDSSLKTKLNSLKVAMKGTG
jgi:F-type H+-transporting ATPase subunit delta